MAFPDSRHFHHESGCALTARIRGELLGRQPAVTPALHPASPTVLAIPGPSRPPGRRPTRPNAPRQERDSSNGCLRKVSDCSLPADLQGSEVTSAGKASMAPIASEAGESTSRFGDVAESEASPSPPIVRRRIGRSIARADVDRPTGPRINRHASVRGLDLPGSVHIPSHPGQQGPGSSIMQQWHGPGVTRVRARLT